MASSHGDRARSHQLAAALSGQAEVTQIVLGDVLTPAARRALRQRDVVLLPRRPFHPEVLAAILAEGQLPPAVPGLFEVPPDAPCTAMPDATWDRLADPSALLRHVLNPRRLERLLGRLRKLGPQVVVLGGDIAGLLAPHVAGLGLPVVWRVHAHDASLHADAAALLPDGYARRWHLAAAQAFTAAVRIAAPHVRQLWVASAEDAARFGDDIPHDRLWLVPDARDVDLPGASPEGPPEQDPIAAALNALGLPAARPSRAAKLLPDGEVARFNPRTRLLDWRFLVQDAGPFAVARVITDTGESPPNAFVTLHPRRRGLTEVEVLAVLPRGLTTAQLAVSVSGGEGLLHRPPASIPEEGAGLMVMTPVGGQQVEVLAWTDTADPRFVPELTAWPVTTTQVPGATVLRGRIRLPNTTRAVGITPAPPEDTPGPDAGVGQVMRSPVPWTRTPPTSSRRLAAMANRHRGETAWLIGNGPGVRVEDLDALEGRLTFGFNRFHLAHGKTRLRPRYTVTGDPQMITDFGQEIVDESGGTVFVADGIPPALTGDHIWVRQMGISPPLFSTRPDRQVSTGGSSVYVAMQIGYLMGVRQFFLYGADFRFAFTTTDGADGARAASGDGNHFIDGYRGGRPWHPPDLRDITTAFLTARRVMEIEGGFIRNASRGGLLEIFDRQPFESALAIR
ncbi:hypothetical protein ACQW02_00950 [Humitalea sp. 24SJ18S-53]|uniref:hypothetical protein n=1 Tax=Humitalea sp. 24SJ18S-53 TaxID=3422307 RepID=UPI003D67FF7B